MQNLANHSFHPLHVGFLKKNNTQKSYKSEVLKGNFFPAEGCSIFRGSDVIYVTGGANFEEPASWGCSSDFYKLEMYQDQEYDNRWFEISKISPVKFHGRTSQPVGLYGRIYCRQTKSDTQKQNTCSTLKLNWIRTTNLA